MKTKTVTTSGYISVYEPTHPDSWKSSGSIFEHRLNAEKMLGRRLTAEEDVHHLDEDKTNNHPDNLLVLEKGQHAKLHGFLDKYYLVPKPGTVLNKLFSREEFCLSCGLVLEKRSTDKFCSQECFHKSLSKLPENFTKESFEKDIWEKPSSKLAEEYGVSGRTIGKWCEKLGIEKPGRGYWVKKAFGTL